MAHVVASYSCEWKAAYSDPATQARFAPFLNTSERDPSIEFDIVRGQSQPR